MRTRIPLLEFQNISVSKSLRDHRKILDDVSLTIHAGENVALLGPNGAGKSTLIKLITREYYPLAGEDVVFRVWGMDDWNVADLRGKLGIVTNDLQAQYAPNVKGQDVILSGFFNSVGLFRMRVTSVMREKTRRIMKFLDIGHLQDRPFGEMSTGEARRFLVGRALIHDPRALIFDEPSNSLDLNAQSKLRHVLRKICRSGISVILATHHPEDIVPEIRRVVMFKNGRIFADGETSIIVRDKTVSSLYNVAVKIHRVKDRRYCLADQ